MALHCLITVAGVVLMVLPTRIHYKMQIVAYKKYQLLITHMNR